MPRIPNYQLEVRDYRVYLIENIVHDSRPEVMRLVYPTSYSAYTFVSNFGEDALKLTSNGNGLAVNHVRRMVTLYLENNRRAVIDIDTKNYETERQTIERPTVTYRGQELEVEWRNGCWYKFTKSGWKEV